jgi:hypothetical protein
MSKQSAILAAFLAAPLLLNAQSGGVIEGRVTNSVTGEAVGGVKVRFLDRQSYVHDTVTDSTGAYRLTSLADGDYRGQFSKDGFSGSGSNGPVQVSASVTARADAQIQPWGSLRGRVLDEDGKPAAGVRVEGAGREGTTTDANGEFEFQDLRLGPYTLAAKPEAKTRMQDGVRIGTVAIYYPSVTEPAQAVPIAVRIGENVSGIEIRLKSVPVHRVSGAILNEAGKPVAHATVRLMGRAGAARQSLGSATTMTRAGVPMTIFSIDGPGSEPEIARTESHDDGAFEFPAVEPGDWRLSAEIGEEDDMPRDGVASVLVAEKDIEDVEVRLTSPFAVQVAIDWGTAQAPTKTGFGWNPVRLIPMESQPMVILDPAKNVGNINGIFPGRYRVMPNTGMDGYASAVMWGGRDVNGQVVELTQGAGPFQVIYKSGLGKVSGTVEKGEGASVFLVSNGSGEIVTFRQAICGAGGAFEIGQVPPGDYYVVAFERTEGRGLPTTDVVAEIIPIASSVRVESGSTASANLRMNKWPW